MYRAMPESRALLPFFLAMTIVARVYRRTYRPHWSDQWTSPNSGRMISCSCHGANTNFVLARAPAG